MGEGGGGENISESKPSAQGTHSLGATDYWKSASVSPKRPGPEGQIWGQLLNHRGGQDQLEESPIRSPGKHLMLKRKERTRGQDKRCSRRECREGGSARLTRGRRPAAKESQQCDSQETPKCAARAAFILEGG